MIAGCAASCIAGCCGSMACCALKSGNTSDFRISKFLALLLQATMVTMILVLQSTDMASWMGKIPVVKQCGVDNTCYSLQIAYRLGFATASVFAFHLVLCLLGKCVGNKAINSFWVFKFVFVMGGSFILLFIPNAFFTVWGGIADVALSWFLLIQMVWVLDFGYGWNDIWIKNAMEDKSKGLSGKCWYIGLLGFSVIFLVCSYVWYGFLFRDYADINSNRLILGLNVGVSTTLGVLSVFAPRGGILPGSLVILYIAWLSWSTVLSGSNLLTTDTKMGVGLALAFLLLGYASYRAKLPQVTATQKDQKTETKEPAEVSVNNAEGAVTAVVEGTPVEASAPPLNNIEEGNTKHPAAVEEKKPEEPATTGSWKSLVFINSMHLSAACYLMNLCVSWSHSPRGEETMIAYWVQAVASWVMLTLYAWTLIAPAVCKSRQF